MARNLPTELILLEIAQGLQTLAKNPDLSKTITDAYALNEAEQKKADEAKILMASADQLRAELKAREDAIANIDERIAEAKGIEASNEALIIALDKRKADLNRQADENAVARALNAKEAERLGAIRDNLVEQSEAIKAETIELNRAKENFRKRVDSMKAQTEDL